MRKISRVGSVPLAFLSFLSVLALGSYILWKLGIKPPKSSVCVKDRPEEASGDDKDAPGDRVLEHGAQPANPLPTENISNSALIEQPLNGTIFVKPETACVAPLTVEVIGSDNYFIFLEFLSFPENTVSADSSGPGDVGRSDVSFYAAANSRVSLNVPTGVYSLTYASGKDWHGLSEKFGPDTKYYAANRSLTFYRDNNRLYGNIVQLFPQSGGSSLYRQLDPSDFPG
jgi:hypothetical protein